MNVDALIQLMRLCSIAKIRKELERLEKKDPESYQVFVKFYEKVSK